MFSDAETSANVDTQESCVGNFSRQTLGRSSMLKHKSDIEALFRTGRKANIEYIRYTYKNFRTDTKSGNVRIFVSAPKKYFHHAVDRNLMKRRMREAIRKNLSELRKYCAESNICLDIAFVMQTNIIRDYSDVERIIVISLQKIFNEVYEKI
ncbi:MAG: ribonuclease P protein component [Bacteroidales bacterium]|nr:ribonuclease P protein component [Bacteroidales bacterium]